MCCITSALTNSIIANNTGGNCVGTITDGGSNVVFGDTSCSGVNLNPVLGTPTGSRPYLPIGAGSAALHRGNPSVCAAAVGAPSYGAGGVDQLGAAHWLLR